MIVCCDSKALPRADKAGKLQIDRPNRIKIPTGDWITVTCLFPSTIETLSDPGGQIVAVPECEKPSDTTYVYSSTEPSGTRTLFLHAIGQWRLRSLGSAVEAKILDAYNGIAALFNAGIRIASGTVNIGTFTPGTFTSSHDTEETVDAASEEVLAAGTYKHIYFRNTSTGNQRITISADGGAAVDKEGWVLAPDPTGAGYGEILAWNHPDVMPLAPFNAIASAAGGKLIVTAGT